MEHFLETWGYLAVFILSFISSMGLPVGAEVAIIYGGVLASGQIANEPHHLNLVAVIVVATLAEVLGSLVGYLIGYFGGRPLVDRVGKYVLLTHKDLDRAEAWFARRGEPVVLFGRFIPLLRSFVSLAAGLGEMARGEVPALHRHRLRDLVHGPDQRRLWPREQLPPGAEGLQLCRLRGRRPGRHRRRRPLHSPPPSGALRTRQRRERVSPSPR